MTTKDEWKCMFESAKTVEERVALVELHILTEGQRLWLDDNRITVKDVLTEKFSVGKYAQVQFLFGEWNRVVGYTEFKV